ncbi:MAG: chemotaxis response regulator protein-glutamate methylesterase [Microcoleus sp. SIO2G3]|nr:chemotaxis response regulator protein-glutamate methylesterase [Microcoleus sp. SIO2G3]
MRIAIVNDTLIATEALRRIIRTVPNYVIAWSASDGAQAVMKCVKDTPDLILMDLIMPVMDGVEATRRIMSHSPCAILIVTSTVKGHSSKVFEAMGYGALDVVNTPILGTSGYPEGGASLLAKIATISKLIGKAPAKSSQRLLRLEHAYQPKRSPPLVVIGASTGGPQAIAAILTRLSKDFPAAVVIIQHVDEQFAPGLAEWLNAQSALPVQVAMAFCQPEVGKVLLAGTNDHLILQPNLTLNYIKEPHNYAYRPSADVFFKSAAKHWRSKGVGVLLTGMGRDGAMGLGLLRSAGWHTIAQDQSSCVVYGMPKAAVELGAVTEVLPVDAIASALVKKISDIKV